MPKRDSFLLHILKKHKNFVNCLSSQNCCDQSFIRSDDSEYHGSGLDSANQSFQQFPLLSL